MIHSYPNHGLFIAFDGIDGVGKTTISKCIAHQLSAVYIRTPTTEITQFVSNNDKSIGIRDFVDSVATTHERFLFYLWSVMCASRQIKSLLSYRNVVCDRYWASTLAYHRAMSPKIKTFDISWLSLVQPNLYVLLDVPDIAICQQRIETRNHRSSNDEQIENNRALQKRVQQEFHLMGLTCVDASQTIDRVISDILLLLGEAQSITSQIPIPVMHTEYSLF